MMVEETFILLVEDNEDDIELTLRALRKGNLLNEVKVVRDGAEALDFLFARGQYESRESTLPQVVLLDINLPKLSGLEVLREMRNDERTRLTPVVVLTTSDSDEDVAESYGNGANSYIRKPINSSNFADAVNRLGAYWLLLNQPAR